MSEIRERCRGRWQSLLPDLGVDTSFLRNRQGPCPVCAGKDRFRYDNKNGDGTSYCNHCGARDGFRLAMDVNGWDFATAAKEVEAIVGGATVAPIAERCDDEVRAVRRAIVRASVEVQPGDLASRYLAARGLGAYRPCSDLRAIPSSGATHVGKTVAWPGMIAIVRDDEGNPTTIHRTPIKGTNHGKRMLAPGSFASGGAVRLFPVGPVLGVAEGIETAIAAALLHDVPVWSLISADNLAAFTPPAGVERLIVFGDNDASFTGHAVAYALARKAVAKGLRAEVRIPGNVGEDWNDVLLQSRMAVAA